MTDIVYSVNTRVGAARRILNFLDANINMYVGIGKPTEWKVSDLENLGLEYRDISDADPPQPSPLSNVFPEPIIYKKVQSAKIAIKNTICPTLQEKGNYLTNSITERNYSFLEREQVEDAEGNIIAYPTHLYISTYIEGTEYTQSSFRAAGFFTNVELVAGANENALTYLGEEIEKATMQLCIFSTPIQRYDEKTHHLEFLLQL